MDMLSQAHLLELRTTPENRRSGTVRGDRTPVVAVAVSVISVPVIPIPVIAVPVVAVGIHRQSPFLLRRARTPAARCRRP